MPTPSLTLHVYALPHAEQRYDTCGDWHTWSSGTTSVYVSAMSDRRHMLLVAIHELIEAELCRHRGIADERVTHFDTNFAGDGEPGDSPRAPYHREHVFASRVEEMLAHELDVDWPAYEAALDALSQERTK